MRVLITVTHLLGTGHLSRALTLGRAFAERGHEVVVASGGAPAPHLDTTGVTLVQLPPLRSDGTDFTRLLKAEGTLADDAYRAARTDALLACLSPAPDLLITELFPFGRRNLRAEFTALLEAARALPRPPRILSSIRDILAPPSKLAKADWADEMITRFYDGVLVHSDPVRTELSLSWPVSGALAGRLIYTGYVAPAPAGPHPQAEGTGEVLVSAGGGPVGDGLFRAALAAAKLDDRRPWRLLVGGGADRIATLQAEAPANATLEPPRRDFRQMLSHAAASVSMCGYNTALDILQAGTPAVFVPFDAGNEVEQGLRAESLSALPGIASVPSAELDADTLLNAVARVTSEGKRGRDGLRDDGAAETVRICEGMVCA
ncbi:glycosyltransferase family protein [Marinibacterium profundimaris]|uniref:Glycosyltransferase n=1 Tax=Marinibacterium profundimaris TaxID=1679460 RepID=A0A225ND42_9RHOB|nr:glycosyltransferase [Marinibacterium profundimaris]OWU69507.1 glycosyltransferase [Marinibacterium profundimaris]